MRYIFVLLGFILSAAFGAAAQQNLVGPAPLSPNPDAAVATPVPVAPSTSLFALASPNLDATIRTPTPAAQNIFMPASLADPAALAPSSTAGPQAIPGVFENYSWQAYVGYTFVRFYELPDVAENQNGVNGGVTWFYNDWLGVDVEALGVHGTLGGASSWTVFAGVGPRVRMWAGRSLEVFGHTLIGGAAFWPDTPYGSQGAFGYELGGGVDFRPHRSKFALRLEGDVLGTRFFQTNQWSPKVSAGIVYKF
ncbi:MAG: hypothetical protein ABSB65_05610 [Candidatus Acidiferrales bacterium]|jgi:hypothetical protein